MKNKLQELTKKLYDEGLGAGFGDDLRRLVLSLPDQTVGFGTAFLQPAPRPRRSSRRPVTRPKMSRRTR